MTQEPTQISTPDAILRIKKLIENNQGDEGRLRFISETLQKGKKLFHSDQSYLYKKISAEVIPLQIKKSEEPDERIKDVKRLIALKFGDLGRLQFILQTLENKKMLYRTDEHYLQTKNKKFIELSEGKRSKRLNRSQTPTKEIHKTEFLDPFAKKIEEKSIAHPPQDIPEKLQGIEEAVLSPEPKSKQTSDLFDLIDETPKVDLEIQQEQERIAKLKHNHEQIKVQQDELSQLIAYRQEYELKINHEKEILEKEIRFEQKKVEEKDYLVAELIKNQSKLLQTKTEREVLSEQIKIDKEKSEKQLAKMQEELNELKKEYKLLQKEIESKKRNLENQINGQKKKNEKLKEDSEEE